MGGEATSLQRTGVRCDSCGAEVPRHLVTVRADRRRWLFYAAALVSIVVLWLLLGHLGVPGEVMQYGMFVVNLPAVALVLWSLRYPRLRVFTCPKCGVNARQPVSGRRQVPPVHPAPPNSEEPPSSSPV